MTRTERREGGGPRERELEPAAQRVFLPEERLPFAAALWLCKLCRCQIVEFASRLGNASCKVNLDP